MSWYINISCGDYGSMMTIGSRNRCEGYSDNIAGNYVSAALFSATDLN